MNHILNTAAQCRFHGGITLALLAMAAILSLIGCEGEGAPQGLAGVPGPPGPPPVIAVNGDGITVQDAIDSLPTAGGTVFIKAGIRTIAQGIHIDRSNVTLAGESGTILVLANHVNQPVLLIGSDEQTPVSAVGNIHISGLQIDGNQDNQDSETDPTRDWLRNNGISLINAHDVWIQDVDIHNTVSGGLVTSYGCRRVFVDNVSCHHNAYDGIALYDSRDMIVSNFISYQNTYAGLSLDNELSFVLFADGIIRGHDSVGIFARNSDDLSFHDLIIVGNSTNGCFLGRDLEVEDGGVNRLTFSGCSFLDNGRHGLVLADDQSTNNSVIGCLFSGNAGDSVHTDPGATLHMEGNIFQ